MGNERTPLWHAIAAGGTAFAVYAIVIGLIICVCSIVKEMRTPEYKVGQIWYRVIGNPWESSTNSYEVMDVRGEWVAVAVTHSSMPGYRDIRYYTGNWTSLWDLELAAFSAPVSTTNTASVTNTVTATQWVYCVDRVVTQLVERPFSELWLTNGLIPCTTNALFFGVTTTNSCTNWPGY